jgi:signal transduction histidine kinase
MVEQARRWFGSARARILVAYLAVLVLSAFVALVGVRHLLVTRAAEHVDDTLDAHVDRFRHSMTLQRPGSRDEARLRVIFDAYLDRVHLQEEETFVAFVDGRHYRTVSDIDPPGPQAGRLRSLADTTSDVNGEYDTETGVVHYVVAPVRLGGRPRGALAVTLHLDSDWINGPLRLATGLVTLWLLLGSVLAFVVSGRVLTPLNELAETARAINESDLTRRIPVRGHNEVSELARTFNAMLDRLESTFAAQRNFTSDVGHDLRTPITIIRGHLELMPSDPEERRRTVDLVVDELDRMARLVNDLLVMARAGRPDFLKLEPLDLQDLAQELYEKATALAPREWRLVDATPARLVADRQRLTEAVMNLADNAVRSTHEDEVIELGASLRNGDARIWVRDGGAGITTAEQSRIFERFARGREGRGDRRDGTGLGLAIVRAIAEAHGGRVGVHSRPGLGATFEIIIPLEPEEEVAEP